MPRIFASLAISELLLLTASAWLGVAGTAPRPDRHILLAVLSLLLSCLIQVVALTYLSVTGKMIAQAVHLGKLGLEPLEEARRLKRSLTHALAWVGASIALVSASGGHHWRLADAPLIHFAAAGLLVTVHLCAYYREYDIIVRNSRLLDGVLRRYNERRPSVVHPQDIG